ncbi:DUF1493 family protein [Hymenobacter negativus]|uniref:DUF1493 family protein n=1 Tax=Hymenobacter negativus TaxID=2795026 RepID=A0ABS3QJ49_9BACT|nr:DUF1493 family protein [Hymenobacter negativus]MBO2011003.1 DUF1493 family protein [Hymenobacter negativus]
METQEIAVRFADLRRVATSVPPYIKDLLGVTEPVTFRSAIEDDFGLCGLDTESLLTQFGEKYQVDLTRFDFTDCISSEVSESSCLLVLVLLPAFLALFILAWTANIIAAICYAPFGLEKARLMLRAGIGNPATIARTLLFPNVSPRPQEKILTVSDFVASAATGYFVKRENVRFILAE